MRCPTCGGPDGLALFTTIDPCPPCTRGEPPAKFRAILRTADGSILEYKDLPSRVNYVYFHRAIDGAAYVSWHAEHRDGRMKYNRQDVTVSYGYLALPVPSVIYKDFLDLGWPA